MVRLFWRGTPVKGLPVKVIYPPGLTRAMQLGLGVGVVLVTIPGYRGFLRRHPPARAWRER